MSEVRRIDYTIAPDGKSITITGQTHRGEEFTADGCWFKAPNGVSLRSLNFPCVSCDGVVYVRGQIRCDDNVSLRDSRQRIAEIADAFDAYNEAGKGEEVDEDDTPVKHVCPECLAEVDLGDVFCRTCGIWMDDTDPVVIEALKIAIDEHCESAMRPAMHARLRALVAGEKEKKNG